ncbi:MAG: phage head-tail connector protein [Clostridiales bacterium]|jgi:hypothetical protein|nr:phage head-tail connector protein [Clostridiales bacterium]
MDQLTRLKIKLEIKNNDADDLLSLLLTEAEEFILSYTRRSAAQWIPAFSGIQTQIAVINYGRLGAEGLQGRSEGGISTSFLGVTDYPDSVIKTLNPYRLIKGLR